MGNELYKVKENLSNKIMNLAFSPRTLNTIYKHKPIFLRNSVNSSKYGLNSLRFLASKVWQMIPIEITNLKSLKIFISNIKKWELNEYVCKLYKDFISSLG